MICKWCGAKVERTDKKCRRCGKEAPAMSECGGFYPPPKPAVVGDPRTAAPRYPAQPQQKKKSGGGLLIILCVLMAVVLLLRVFSLMMVLTNSRKLEQLSKKDSAPAATAQLTEASAEATEPLTLAQQDVTVRVDFDPTNRDKGEGVEVTAAGAESVKTQGYGGVMSGRPTRYVVTVMYEEAGRNHELDLDLRSSDREEEAIALLDPEDELELTDDDLSAFACKVPECFGEPADEKDYGFSLKQILDRNGNAVVLSKYSLEGKQERMPVAFLRDEEAGTVYFVIYADFLEAMEEDALKKDDVAYTYEFCYTNQDGGTLTIALGDINYRNISND